MPSCSGGCPDRALVESGVLILVPAADPLVGAWRERLDPSAGKGVPAHITLLYPFAPPHTIDESILQSLRDLYAGVPPFPFELGRAARFPSVVYLEPDPSEAFRRLIDATAARFPDLPPYGGEFDDVVPHLTVAQSEDDVVLSEVEAGLLRGLPIVARALEAVLMVEGDDGRWRLAERFPFGGG